jgi:signal recognition particle receptor subunit beta
MPVFNYAKKEVNIKIVYYGPGLSGKTTNLQAIHDGIKPDFKGKLVSLATQTDRTLFFDFMPLELGSLGGFRIRLHLYTVPGQVHYNATRKLVLKGVDGVVFVADSQKAMKDANIESFMNLQNNLQSYGKTLKDTPHIIQANKRDLNDIIPMEELSSLVNKYSVTLTEAVASEGEGVLETLTEIVRIVLKNLKEFLAVHRGEAREIKEADSAAKGQVPGAMQPDPAPGPELKPETEPGPDMDLETVRPAETNEAVAGDIEPEIDEISQDEESETELSREKETPLSGTAEADADLVTAEPVLVTVPLDGVGTVELAISIKAKIVPGTGEKILKADLGENNFQGGKGVEQVPSAEAGPGGEPELSKGNGQGHPGNRSREGTRDTSLENLPPLTEITDEPLGLPMEGHSVNIGDLEELPGRGYGIKQDGEPKNAAATEKASVEPLSKYDPTLDHVDLFEVEKSKQDKPDPKRKGVLGLFKRKP